MEVPLPRRCSNPAGSNPFDIPPSQVTAHLLLDGFEPDPGDATWLSPLITSPRFVEYSSFEDESVVIDPYEGPDDCIVYSPLRTVATSRTLSAGTVSYAVAGQVLVSEPWWGYNYYAYGLWYDPFMLFDLPTPILYDALWGAPLSVTATGDEIPAFSLVDAVIFPAEPIAISSPAERAQLAAAALQFEWDPTTSEDRLLAINMSFAGRNALCFVEDDGTWSPPPTLWNGVSDFPLGISISVSRQDTCAYSISADQFVQVTAMLHVGYSVTITGR